MGKVELKVRVSEEVYSLLVYLSSVYRMSIDEVVEMCVERTFLSDQGIVLVPAERLERAKGVAVIDANDGSADLIPFDGSDT